LLNNAAAGGGPPTTGGLGAHSQRKGRGDEVVEPLTVGTLRELFRHIEAFRALYVDAGVDVITGPEGQEWCLWDVEYLLDQVPKLPPRQRDSIMLCLVQGQRETDVAVLWGLSPDNPVLSYAAEGLKRIVRWVNEGQLDQFRSRPRVLRRVRVA
jgi:DNA-directed RNA polymerase specialized sigma24 family protein